MIYSPTFLVASPVDQYQSNTQRVDFQTNQGVVFAPKEKPPDFWVVFARFNLATNYFVEVGRTGLEPVTP